MLVKETPESALLSTGEWMLTWNSVKTCSLHKLHQLYAPNGFLSNGSRVFVAKLHCIPVAVICVFSNFCVDYSILQCPNPKWIAPQGDKLSRHSVELRAITCYWRINLLVWFRGPLAFIAMMSVCINRKMPSLDDIRKGRGFQLRLEVVNIQHVWTTQGRRLLFTRRHGQLNVYVYFRWYPVE